MGGLAGCLPVASQRFHKTAFHVSAGLTLQMLILSRRRPLLRFHRRGQPVIACKRSHSPKPFAIPDSPHANVHDHNFQKVFFFSDGKSGRLLNVRIGGAQETAVDCSSLLIAQKQPLLGSEKLQAAGEQESGWQVGQLLRRGPDLENHR